MELFWRIQEGEFLAQVGLQGGQSGRRGFLLRLPFEGVGGKEGGELGQCDRLFRGVDDSFQLGLQAHSVIGTSNILPEVEAICARIEAISYAHGRKKPLGNAERPERPWVRDYI
jgi:hypothetical protein